VSAGMEISCPSAWTSLSGYMEYELSALRALRANDPGRPAELPPAWPRLGEIDVPALLMVGQLDTRNLQLISEQAAALIPEAQFRRPLDGVAHLPHLEGDPSSLEQITDFVNLLP
jgi:pimeloyl-ACP methyl ester carboxylesterase